MNSTRKFLTNKERKPHPVAGQIPDDLHFGRGVVWLCIAIGHPEASDEDLLLIAEILGVFEAGLTGICYKTFELAAALGKLNFLQCYVARLMPEYVSSVVLGCHSGQSYRLAAAHGQTEVLKYLESLVPDIPEQSRGIFMSAFKLTWRKGHQATAFYILSNPECF